MPPSNLLPELSAGAGLSDTAPVIEVVERLAAAEHLPVSLEGIDRFYNASPLACILPNGKSVKSLKAILDEYRPHPDRIRTAAVVTTLASFVDYVNRFRRPETALFAEDAPDAPKLLGLIDFHGQGQAALPSYNTHAVTYSFPLSDALKAWVAATERCLDPRKGGLFTQEEFAYFLQDHNRDIENPPADWMMLDQDTIAHVCDLLNLHDDLAPQDEHGNYLTMTGQVEEGAVDEDEEDDRFIPQKALDKLRKVRFGSAHLLEKLAVGISLSLEMKVEQKYDTKTGKKTIHFKDEHEARTSTGRKVNVPDMFFLNIPVFESGERHLLPVRLFYRPAGTSLRWGVELVEPDRMVRLAVNKAARHAAAETGCPVYFGKPHSR